MFNPIGQEANDLQKAIEEAKRILDDINSTAEQIVKSMSNLADTMVKYGQVQK